MPGQLIRPYVAAGFILLLAGVFAAPPALLAQNSPPTIFLEASGRILAVGETVTINWAVSGADSVSVKRDGVEVSTGHQGEWEETLESEGEITWAVWAANQEGTATKVVNILVVTFATREEFQAQRVHYVAGRHHRFTIGPGVGWALQVIISVIPGPFIGAGIIAPVIAFLLAAGGLGNYWLATGILILLVLSILVWVLVRSRWNKG